MSKKFGIVLTIISVIALGLSIAALIIVSKPQDSSNENAGDIQYVMYLGTNDKDTNEPVFEPEEAKEKAKEILIDKFGGYTIQTAEGGWIDNDKIYQEYTLVIYLSDTDMDQVHTAADQLLETFNQNSVLIQSNNTTTEFYSGSNKQ